MNKLINTAFSYLFVGLFMGAFYREFTKFLNFEGDTMLSIVHTHLIMLGFIVTIILLLLEKSFNISKDKHYNKMIFIYNLGVIITILMMIVRGVSTVLNMDLGKMTHAISGISGIGHISLTVGFILMFMVIKKSAKVL